MHHGSVPFPNSLLSSWRPQRHFRWKHSCIPSDIARSTCFPLSHTPQGRCVTQWICCHRSPYATRMDSGTGNAVLGIRDLLTLEALSPHLPHALQAGRPHRQGMALLRSVAFDQDTRTFLQQLTRHCHATDTPEHLSRENPQFVLRRLLHCIPCCLGVPASFGSRLLLCVVTFHIGADGRRKV